MSLRIGTFASTVTPPSVEEVVADAVAAEAAGLSSFWLPQIFGYDALTVLALAAQATDRIELGTAVVPTYPRHPAALAAQAATVQKVAGGRFTLGIGLSHQPVIEGAFAMSFDRPLRHMREYLDILMPLVDGRPADTDGETLGAHLSLDIPDLVPVPVLVAALGPKMLELAGAATSGTSLWMTGPTTITDHVIPTLHGAAEAAGAPSPRVVCSLPVCVTDDADRARARAAKVFAIYGQLPSYRAMLDREGAAGPEDLAIIGSEDEVSARIAAVAAAGATDFAGASFARDPEDRARTMALLGSLAGA